ncbi:hypothetical protein GCM10007938_43320 [Vibrio zhanjiangensis]|uniref:Uncharacterized protein n=1 Tax=Vibrio zhanjiangensis TaxID=1046128 RepID=A0ABQ6F763_9VIBR|nr:hypothetical protein GCM10007938_43320 [Vibrio zhanjiangensis]
MYFLSKKNNVCVLKRSVGDNYMNNTILGKTNPKLQIMSLFFHYIDKWKDPRHCIVARGNK